MNVATRTQQNGAEHIENFKLIVIWFRDFFVDIYAHIYVQTLGFTRFPSLAMSWCLQIEKCFRNCHLFDLFFEWKDIFFDLCSNFIHFQSLVSDDTTPTHSSNVNDLKPVKGFSFCSFFLFSIEASAEMATN